MKSITLSLVLFICLIVPNASATILTVSNYPPVPAQYNDINAAITAATPGDTIYVHGSPTAYSNTYITKQVVLIGAGYNPKNDFPYTSLVWTQINIYIAGSGSSFIGMSCQNLNAGFAGSGSDTVRNLTFKNCMFYQGGLSVNQKNYDNILVENCVFIDCGNALSFTSPGVAYQVGLVVRNCVFSNTPVAVESNSIVDHCIFIGSNTGTQAFYDCSNATFSNNIIDARTISTIYVTNCIFNNNLTHNCSNNTLPPVGSTGSGNIINADPMFVSFPAVPTSFAFTHNYRLQTTSPGHNAATDGTDLGIYGNNFLFSMTGEPVFMPVMRKLDIYNTTVPFNGTLDVHYKSSVPVRD